MARGRKWAGRRSSRRTSSARRSSAATGASESLADIGRSYNVSAATISRLKRIAGYPQQTESSPPMGNIRPLGRKPPRFLYKYRPLADSPGIDFSIVAASKIYHPNPTQFNDPFDCRVGSLGAVEPSFVRYLIAARRATPDKHHEIYTEFREARLRTPDELRQLNGPLDKKRDGKIHAIFKHARERQRFYRAMSMCSL